MHRRTHHSLAVSVVALAVLGVTPITVSATVSALEQYMLELINRARADPQGEADLYLSGNLNEGLSPGTITTTAKQPLAFDTNLDSAAEGHTAYMIANDVFTHTGSGGTTSHQRMSNAGYPFSGSFGSGENLAARSNFGGDIDAASVLQLHINLFQDFTVAGRGHRIIMLSESFESVGIAADHTSSFDPLSGFPSDLATQDFAYTSSQGPFLTGVAYDDADEDDFYTPGEGLGGLAVTAFSAGTSTVAGSTTTGTAGGYALQLAAGSYDLQITGSLGTLLVEGIVLGVSNLKFDYTNDTASAGGSGGSGLPAVLDLILN